MVELRESSPLVGLSSSTTQQKMMGTLLLLAVPLQLRALALFPPFSSLASTPDLAGSDTSRRILLACGALQQPHRKYSPTTVRLGYSLGWISSIFYFNSRIPQVCVYPLAPHSTPFGPPHVVRALTSTPALFVPRRSLRTTNAAQRKACLH